MSLRTLLSTIATMPRDIFYTSVVGLTRTLFAVQGLKITMTGLEHVPEKGGAVIVANHTGYLDFMFAGVPFRKYKRLIRFMAKSSVFEHRLVGPIMRAMNHIPVDRIDGQDSYRRAVQMLRDGELVGIFPESTISRSFEIKDMRSGAVRMAQEANVPIIPVIIFGSQRIWTKGQKKNLGRTNTPIHIKVLEPSIPQGSPETATIKLSETMKQGLEAIWNEYQAAHGAFPAGALWVPARFGGGAPTLQEAQTEDCVVEAERHRIRKLREDLAALNTQIKALLPRSGKTEEDPQIIAWIKNTMEELSNEVTLGVSDGKEKIVAAVEQIKTSAAQINPSDLAPIAAQARLILSRLPHRKRLHTLPAAIICDLEGTLLTSEGQISPATLSALERAHNAGSAIIFATGFVRVPITLDFPVHTVTCDGTLSTLASGETETIADATKATGVAWVLEKLGIPASDAVAFGDGRNDIEMLQYVGTGIAMGNADPNVIRAAKWVTGTNDEDGIAEVIEPVLPNEE
ncbi:1-acyl-sn-glycerol-3-phosphate acyltransferase [Corynebacterium freiburgense]|nr:1-acyl-sn-glycerol-3-phosphate acyltransferase [Corynebacterium freiburgense]